MPVKAKYIKDLPLKKVLDGSESLLVQDLNGTQQAPLEVIVDEIKQNSQEKIREIESELAQTNAQLSEVRRFFVCDEKDIDEALKNQKTVIIFQQNITITTPKILDRIYTVIDLNGFELKLDETFNDSFIFEIGKTEYDDFENHYYKWIKNGIINMNNRDAYPLNHFFSWNLSCENLRVVNAINGFIKYGDTPAAQKTRGAESLLNDITIIGSDLVKGDSIAFEWKIGDSILKNLYSHYFHVGLKMEVGGCKISDSHFWGLPQASGIPNKIMHIGVWDNHYNNTYFNVISDTAERVSYSEVPSPTNGGIAFYDQTGANTRYISCDVCEHTTQPNYGVIGFYIDKPSTIDDEYYGQGIVIDSCQSRLPSKIQKGIHFTGIKRNISVRNSGLAINSSGYIRNYDTLTSNATVFKKDTATSVNEKVPDFSYLNDANEFMFMNDDYGITVGFTDSQKNKKYSRLRERNNNVYTSTQLQAFAEKLKIQQDLDGQWDNMMDIFVIKFNSSIGLGTLGRFELAWWNPFNKNFINMRTGETLTT